MYIIISILNIYAFLIIARALLTWIPNLDTTNPIIKFLWQVTEPVLQPIRKALPPSGGIDFSPIVVIVVLTILTNVLARI